MHKLFLILALTLLTMMTQAQSSTFKNSIGMEFVLIQPGSFVVGKFHPPYPIPSDTMKKPERNLIMWMGDGRSYSTQEFQDAEKLGKQARSNGFEVSVDKAFYLGKFEVTQAQWRAVMGNNPSTFQINWVQKPDDHPVENVSWEDAQAFVKKLNKLEKGKTYRLPTEFEWEYAARAGEREKDIPWKMVQETAHLGSKTTQPVGTKQPNGYGLYDMLGNVWEWVDDVYNGRIFADKKPVKKGTQHVLKGASFAGDVKNATYMTHAAGPGNGWDVGFRILLEVHQNISK